MFLRSRFKPYYLCALYPVNIHDVVKENISLNERPTGWNGIKKLFTKDEINLINPEINFVKNTIITGGAVGAFFGGYIYSKRAYMDFVQNNQATSFETHLDAKSKLQHEITTAFIKGGFLWGWKVACFAGSFLGITTLISAYRGKAKFYDYAISGAVTGALFRLSYGLPSFIVGGLLGGVLGFMSGLLIWGALKITGNTMEDVFVLMEMEAKLERQKNIPQKETQEEDVNYSMLLHHDRINYKEDLNDLSSEAASNAKVTS